MAGNVGDVKEQLPQPAFQVARLVCQLLFLALAGGLRSNQLLCLLLATGAHHASYGAGGGICVGLHLLLLRQRVAPFRIAGQRPVDDIRIGPTPGLKGPANPPGILLNGLDIQHMLQSGLPAGKRQPGA